MLSREGKHPCAVICHRRGSLIDFARVPTSCKNMLRVRNRGERERELMTSRLVISVIRRVRGKIAAERMAGARDTLYIIPDTDRSS